MNGSLEDLKEMVIGVKQRVEAMAEDYCVGRYAAIVQLKANEEDKIQKLFNEVAYQQNRHSAQSLFLNICIVLSSTDERGYCFNNLLHLLSIHYATFGLSQDDFKKINKHYKKLISIAKGLETYEGALYLRNKIIAHRDIDFSQDRFKYRCGQERAIIEMCIYIINDFLKFFKLDEIIVDLNKSSSLYQLHVLIGNN